MRLPYPGLRPFHQDESDLFFGREGCVDGIIDRLAATRFLAVLGASGSGKSSLVITGLLDALELGLHASAGSRWRIAYMRPGGGAIDSLGRALLVSGSHPFGDLDVDLLASYLRRGPRSVSMWCADGNLEPGTNLLILVDQFEELFRYGDYSGREEAEAFVALLLESARTGEAPIHVAITMRSEFLGACALIPGLAEAINAGLYLVPRMSREEVRASIEGPAGVCGFAIEPALVNRLLNDLASLAPWESDPSTDQLQRLSRRADQLPLMQHVLSRMWLRASEADRERPVTLHLADYDALDGLRGALDAHAFEVYASLDRADHPLVTNVFRALVSGTSLENAVRRPCSFGELVALADRDREAVLRIIERFRAPDCNFLTPPPPTPITDQTIIDISHESLIRQWSLLREWVQTEFESSQTYRHIQTTAELWEKQESGLLTMPFLGLALAWRSNDRPNAVWAARYGGDFPLAMRFLDASAARRRQRRLGLRAMIAFVIVASVAVAFIQSRKAQSSKAELQTAQFQNAYLTQVAKGLAEEATKIKDENLNDEFSDWGIPAQDALKTQVEDKTPTTIPGGWVLHTRDLTVMVNKTPAPLLIDALEGDHPFTIPSAMGIPFAGRGGNWTDEIQHRLTVRLSNLTNGDMSRSLVFFCEGSTCWESYNAALRAIHAGYKRVYWYRGGLLSWQAANFDYEPVYHQAVRLQGQLANPGTITYARYRWALAVTLGEMAKSFLKTTGDLAVLYTNIARENLQSALTSLPDNPDLMADIIRVSLLSSQAYARTHDPDHAAAALSDAQSVRDKVALLAARSSDHAFWIQSIAGIDQEIGERFYSETKYHEAGISFQNASISLKTLVAASPNDNQLKESLGWSLISLGFAEFKESTDNKGMAAFNELLDLASQWAVQSNDANWLNFVDKVGEKLIDLGKLDDALAAYQGALATATGILAKDTNDSNAQAQVATEQAGVSKTLGRMGKYDDALATVKAAIATNQAILAKDSQNSDARDRIAHNADELGALTYKFVLASQFDKALTTADIALSLAPENYFVIENRASALMFLGRLDEAKDTYLKYRDKTIDNRSWDTVVKDNFADFRKHGLSNPLMDVVEKALGTS